MYGFGSKPKKTESPVIKNSGSTHLTRPTKAGSPLAILLDTYVRGDFHDWDVPGRVCELGSHGDRIKWVNFTYTILINGGYWGYNPFYIHLLPSWDPFYIHLLPSWDIQGGLIVVGWRFAFLRGPESNLIKVYQIL